MNEYHTHLPSDDGRERGECTCPDCACLDTVECRKHCDCETCHAQEGES